MDSKLIRVKSKWSKSLRIAKLRKVARDRDRRRKALGDMHPATSGTTSTRYDINEYGRGPGYVRHIGLVKKRRG